MLSRAAQTTAALTRLKPVWKNRSISVSSKIPHISYIDHVTNEEVHAEIQQAIGPHEDLLTIVKRHKLQWYGRVSRHHQVQPKPSFKAQ